MCRWVRLGAAVAALAAARVLAAEIPAIAYHDIVPIRNGDPYAITVEDFERQLAYLRWSGYRPVSLRELEAAREGRAALPAKPVLLTFDDGYMSYYEHAYPRLERYGFPSVVSVVTSWVDRRTAPDYTAAPIMGWDELRAVARSPLVEVLSHSDDLHRNVRADPFDTYRPAGVTRRYDAATGRYETDAAHRRRVADDLARSAARIEAELGRRPAGIAWPYGQYEQVLVEAAAALGMRFHLTLDSAPTRLADLPRVNRTTFRDYRRLADFGDMLSFRHHRRHQWRLVEIDLAGLAALEADAQAEAIAALARRMELLRVDAVLLRPFTPDGRWAYFHNEAVPFAADLLSRVGHQLANRAGLLHLYLSIPPAASLGAYPDLARLNWFTGVLFEGAPDAAVFEQRARLLRRYKPALKLGVRAADPGQTTAADLVLVDVAADAAGALRHQVAQQSSVAPRAWFLLRRGVGTSDAALRRAMAELRTAGAAHYGYGLDDYRRGQPAPLDIVRALTEHTVLR